MTPSFEFSPVRVFDGAAVAALGGVRVRGRRGRRGRRRPGVVEVQRRLLLLLLRRRRDRRRRRGLPARRRRRRLRLVLPRRRLPPLGRRIRLLRGRLGSVEFLTFISMFYYATTVND